MGDVLMKTPEQPINCAEVLKNAAQSALAGYESSIAHGGIRDEQQENWIVSLFSGMQAIAQVAELKQRLAQVERERDAAVKDLADACKYCKHISCDDEDENSPCKDCMQRKGGVPFGPMVRTRFEWRGVCEENSK